MQIKPIKSCEARRGFPACGGEQLQLPVLLARANGECYAERRALRCVRSRPGDIREEKVIQCHVEDNVSTKE